MNIFNINAVNIYFAFYKAKGKLIDRLVRRFTKSPYSHCEIVLEDVNGVTYLIGMSRDNGTLRMKQYNIHDTLNSHKWDLIKISEEYTGSKERYLEIIRRVYARTINAKIRYLTPFSSLLNKFYTKCNTYTSSEWCAHILDSQLINGYSVPLQYLVHMTPQDVYDVVCDVYGFIESTNRR